MIRGRHKKFEPACTIVGLTESAARLSAAQLPGTQMTPLPSAPCGPSPRFATTRWSLVLQAKDKAAPQARAALADLCKAYWYPLYAFVRKRSRDGHEAQDRTQGFFARLLEQDFLDDVAPERGRFRAFLLAAIKHFIANQIDRERAIKRGGGLRIGSLDAAAFDWESGESRYLTDLSLIHI